jgi:phytoene dehydrogenase-like protein
MPEVWEETFASLGEKMSDHLDLRRIDPTYKVHFDDGLRLELTSDIGKMQTQLEAVDKTAFTGFSATLPKGANITRSRSKNSSGAISTTSLNISA